MSRPAKAAALAAAVVLLGLMPAASAAASRSAPPRPIVKNHGDEQRAGYYSYCWRERGSELTRCAIYDRTGPVEDSVRFHPGDRVLVDFHYPTEAFRVRSYGTRRAYAPTRQVDEAGRQWAFRMDKRTDHSKNLVLDAEYDRGEGEFGIRLTPHEHRCRRARATIVGTPGDDVIEGTPGRDVIKARGGDDIVRGRGGHDLTCGGHGDDRLNGGKGRDRAFGQDGSDRMRGGHGPDKLFGGRGPDRLSGQRGDDRAAGNRGEDRILNGAGDDLLFGGAGADRIDAGTGGGLGRDDVFGGAGNDRIEAANGSREEIDCGRGDDLAIVDSRDRVDENCEQVRRPEAVPD